MTIMIWTAGLNFKFNNSLKKVKPGNDTEQGSENEQDNKGGWQWVRLWLIVSTICIISIATITWAFYEYFPRSCDINRPSYLLDQVFPIDKCQQMRLSSNGNFSIEEEQILPGAAENTSISSELPRELSFIERNEWSAEPSAYPLTKLKLPVPYVFIGQSNTESCSTQAECTLLVRFIQMFHKESRYWLDIAYNFIVGGDGLIYIGRNWNYMGAHVYGFNDRSLSIIFIGGINSDVPTEAQLNAVQKLIELGVRDGKIAPDYKLLGFRQVLNTRNPKDNLYAIIKKWPHWSPTP